MSKRQQPPNLPPDDDETVRRSPSDRLMRFANRRRQPDDEPVYDSEPEPRRVPQEPAQRPPRPRRRREPQDPQTMPPPAQQAPTRATRRPARTSRGQGTPPPSAPPEKTGLYVPWWGFVIVILAVAGLTCGMWYVVLANRGDTNVAGVGPSPTPLFVVITATPTLGAAGEAQGGEAVIEPTPTATVPATATGEATEIPEPTVQVGSQIIISGTEDAGLAVRQGPGVDFTYFFVAEEGAQFMVEAGPREADGYTWWYVTDPADSDRAGWAVEDYMLPQTSGGLQEATTEP